MEKIAFSPIRCYKSDGNPREIACGSCGAICMSHFLFSKEPQNMNQPQAKKPDYGNWVSMKFIYVPSAGGLVLLGLAFAFPISIVVAALFLGVAGYFAYARYRFSPRGGDVQGRIEKLVIDHLDWNGQG